MDFEFKLSDHVEHDGYMPNVYPRRKMFSSVKAPKGINESEDNKSNMQTVKALAVVIEADGKLKPVKTQ